MIYGKVIDADAHGPVTCVTFEDHVRRQIPLCNV